MANGSRNLVRFVGPAESRYKNSIGFTGESNMDYYPLLGVIPMEGRDWIEVPETVQLIVVPNSPNISATIAR